jgi:Response regulator of the LytR/AlgR family
LVQTDQQDEGVFEQSHFDGMWGKSKKLSRHSSLYAAIFAGMRTIRVLIVEDEPIIAADLEDRLLEMGYDVAPPCESGEAALLFLQKESVDLVLMDIQLSGQLDGIETAQKVLETAHLPIIYLTSNTDDATFARAKSTLPAAFLTKPFRGKDLMHAIELAISAAARHQPNALETNDADTSAFLFNDRLFVKVKDRMLRIFFQDILWLEADDYYCKLMTDEKEYLVGHTLKQMGEVLERIPEFMRVHRSYIVNLSNVEEIGEGHLLVKKKQIPLNKTAKEELHKRLKKI